MSSVSTQQTEAVLGHHLKVVVAKDVDAILSDFTDASVLYTQERQFRGLGELREFFIGFVGLLTPEVLAKFKIVRQDVDGEIAYIVWTVGDMIPLGSDTFVVRDGKIMVQTLAVHVTESTL
jgi:ketosteroid isomerase-like protein